MRKYLVIIIGFISISFSCQTNTYAIKKNIGYYNSIIANNNSYIKKMCVLDIYYPLDKKNAPTIVWFHGGGLTGGNKFIPEALKKKGLVVVAVNYRLSPNVKNPKYIEDAAAAVAWVFNNIKTYNGNKNKIIVAGHSAGGYLTSMVGLDKTWLKKHNINADNIAAIVPFSGHAITHFTIRKEQGINGKQPIIDAFAPLYHVRKNAPPILLITGDRTKELLGRYEENAYLLRMLKEVGHKNNKLYELQGFNHTSMVNPAYELLIHFINTLNNDTF